MSEWQEEQFQPRITRAIELLKQLCADWPPVIPRKPGQPEPNVEGPKREMWDVLEWLDLIDAGFARFTASISSEYKTLAFELSLRLTRWTRRGKFLLYDPADLDTHESHRAFRSCPPPQQDVRKWIDGGRRLARRLGHLEYLMHLAPSPAVEELKLANERLTALLSFRREIGSAIYFFYRCAETLRQRLVDEPTTKPGPRDGTAWHHLPADLRALATILIGRSNVHPLFFDRLDELYYPIGYLNNACRDAGFPSAVHIGFNWPDEMSGESFLLQFRMFRPPPHHSIVASRKDVTEHQISLFPDLCQDLAKMAEAWLNAISAKVSWEADAQGWPVATATTEVAAAEGERPLERQDIETQLQPGRSPYFHSGDETEGSWTAQLTVTAIGKAIGVDRRDVKKTLGRTGLIQKSRERWIVRLDNIGSDRWVLALKAADVPH